MFADADLEAAARKAAGQYDDAGQVCLAGTRLLVEESVADRFLERFHGYTDEHVLGDPRDDAHHRLAAHPSATTWRGSRASSSARAANGDRIVRGGARRADDRRALVRADPGRAEAPTTPRSSSARCSARC